MILYLNENYIFQYICTLNIYTNCKTVPGYVRIEYLNKSLKEKRHVVLISMKLYGQKQRDDPSVQH